MNDHVPYYQRLGLIFPPGVAAAGDVRARTLGRDWQNCGSVRERLKCFSNVVNGQRSLCCPVSPGFPELAGDAAVGNVVMGKC
ncbi:hypothetical protein RRG08_042822 [Elysia crispata]|uniref:Uncharacterized protein n=1 Tax=Elysia crispata TaxID=231223 RepID=A0AAE0YDA6_9GAST|nr:hypothetical protein RRG08_042822 [Elysia crispata]